MCVEDTMKAEYRELELQHLVDLQKFSGQLLW